MTALSECGCARLPLAALPLLGPLRATPGLRGLIQADALWLFWAEDADLARTILAPGGAELFARREGRWYALDRHLPSFDVPASEESRPLSSLLVPAPVEPISPDVAAPRPLELRLVPCDIPRPCSLLRVALGDLTAWAEHATSHQLASLSATHHEGVLLLRGDRLPSLPGERFWGRRVLFPFGLRPDPDLDEDILAAVLRLESNDLAIVEERGAERVPFQAFAPLTRAGVRLAAREVKA